MTPITINLPDEHATRRLGAAIGRALKPGDAILLEGVLGAGKTALARAILRTACNDPSLDVPSPTYTLAQSYGAQIGSVTHFDLWRLDSPDALDELDWFGACEGVVLVEWPDRLAALRPADALTIHLRAKIDGVRRAVLEGWPPDRLATVHGGMTPALLQGHAHLDPPPRLGGRTLREHAIDRLAALSITQILDTQPDDDPAASVRRAVATGDLAADQPFLLIDGDVAWFDGPTPALARLLSAFASDRFDAILLLARATDQPAVQERVGLVLDPLGIVRRPSELEVAPFVPAGVQILRPNLFDPHDTGVAPVWDRAMAHGRLGGLVHDGVWFHLATAHDAATAEHELEDRLSGARL